MLSWPVVQWGPFLKVTPVCVEAEGLSPMNPHPTRALAVPFLGVLASLQLIDPVVANTALVKAS